MAQYLCKSHQHLLRPLIATSRLSVGHKTSKWKIINQFSTSIYKNLTQHQNIKTCSDINLNPGSTIKYDANWSSNGWRVANLTQCPELNLTSVVHLHHQFCGAQWLHLENPADETNAFSVHFKTVPMDSTGVAHILEHVTLCGSKKFPVRDPFFKMLNRSLSTFMNAMTGPDYTLYPFATQNRQDFYNLLSVYLDAVFKPLLLKEDFLQEGWRLDLNENSDKNDLTIKGVVFNEMKGVFADSQQLFGRTLLNKLLPSHTYGICSGGLPEDIPNLSWNQLKDFHATHYNPDNAKFYTYGNLPLEAHLKAASSYLPEKKPNNANVSFTVPEVPNEIRWKSLKRYNVSCAVDPSSQPPNDTTLAISYVACDIQEVYECFVLQVIGELLVEGPSAPFYKSLIESGLGSGFVPSSGYGAQTKDTIFTIGIQGMDLNKKEEVEKVIKSTFKQVCVEGFEQERVQAILHRTELSLKDRVNNFGLNLIMGLTPGWNHVSDPFLLLKIEENIQRFRNDLAKDPNYLQKKVQEYFVENHHHIVLTMTPKENYVEENQQLVDEVENKLVNKLSATEKDDVIETGKQLLLKQSSQESEEDIASLPSLNIADINEKAPVFEIEHFQFTKSIGGQVSIQPTNGVAYFRALIDTESIQNERYYHWFIGLLSSMGAGTKYDFRKLETTIDLFTGGLSTTHLLAEHHDDLKSLNQGLLLSSRCLERNSKTMFELWSDVFNHVFSNKDEEEMKARLGNLINMSATDSMNGLAYSGHHYAMSNAASKLFRELPATQVREMEGGLASVRFVNKLALSVSSGNTDILDEILSDLARMAKTVLNQSNVKSISLNSTDSHMNKEFRKQTHDFLESLPIKDLSERSKSYNHNIAEVNQTMKTFVATPFPVHFCGAALPTVPYQHPDSAPLRVLAKLVSAKYIHPEIREKGGAYGGGATSNPSSGIFSFYSYRDPNCERTFDTFDRSIDWILSNKFSDRDIQEAKLGIFQAIDKPVLPGERGMRLWFTGITDEMFQEHRHRIRNVERGDLLRVTNKYLKQDDKESKTIGVSVIGPESTAKTLDETWNIQTLLG